MWVEFSGRFSKYTPMPNLVKIRPVGAELLRADGRTDKTDRQTDSMTKLAVAFRNFLDAPKSS